MEKQPGTSTPRNSTKCSSPRRSEQQKRTISGFNSEQSYHGATTTQQHHGRSRIIESGCSENTKTACIEGASHWKVVHLRKDTSPLFLSLLIWPGRTFQSRGFHGRCCRCHRGCRLALSSRPRFVVAGKKFSRLGNSAVWVPGRRARIDGEFCNTDRFQNGFLAFRHRMMALAGG